VNRPALKKPKIGNFGRPPQGAKIFFQDFEYTTFFRTLRSTSDVKMKEIEDVYFFQRVIFSKWALLAPQTNDCLGLSRFSDWPLEKSNQHMAGKCRRICTKNLLSKIPYKRGKILYTNSLPIKLSTDKDVHN
jgi:hypothetical protein